MKTVVYSIIQLIITFFIVMLLNFLMNNYIGMKKGEIQWGSILSVSGQKFLPVSFSNFDNKPVEQLQITIPSYINEHEIVSSQPVRIEVQENNMGNDEEKFIFVSNLKPLRITQFLIPIKSENDVQHIEIMNATEKRIRVISSVVDKTFTQKVLGEAFRDSVFYMLFVSIFFGLQVWHREVRVRELRGQLTDLKSETNRIRAEWTKVKDSCGKCRILLMNKVRDYLKENDFWKDTVRAILMGKYTGKKEANEFVETVTDKLKTYSTRSPSTRREIGMIDYLVKASEDNNVAKANL